MDYLETSGKTTKIKPKEAICNLLSNTIPQGNENYSEIFLRLDSQIKKVFPRVKAGALGTVHGHWYEWLLAIECWNICAQNKNSNLALLLPTKSSYDVTRLYNDGLYSLIEDLRTKLRETSDVQLISSNPDFVIIDRKLVNKVIKKIHPITHIDIATIDQLSAEYIKFSAQCGFKSLIGYLSVKKSFRSDRRLQIPHEGSLMKAIYVHLQTRNWILNPTGLKYYAIVMEATTKDHEALKTVATHSITSVSSQPQPAVDELFEIDSVKQGRQILTRILNLNS